MNQFFGEFSSFSWEKYGQFGDSFGLITAVFAGAAFFLLLKTYKAQKEELRATREIMANQSSVMRMQKFETTFFNFLNLYSSLSDDFIAGEQEWKENALRGSDAFRALVKELVDVFFEEGYFCFSYGSMVRNQKNLAFGQGYKIFITLLNFCSDSLSAKEKKRYFKIISSTLVDGAMIMLVANCAIENDGNNKQLLYDYFFEDCFYKPSLRGNIIDRLRSLLESDVAKI